MAEWEGRKHDMLGMVMEPDMEVKYIFCYYLTSPKALEGKKTKCSMPDSSQVFLQTRSLSNPAGEVVRFYTITSHVTVALEKIVLGCLGFVV